MGVSYAAAVMSLRLGLGRMQVWRGRAGKDGRSLEDTEDVAAERAGCDTVWLFSGLVDSGFQVRVQKTFTGIW